MALLFLNASLKAVISRHLSKILPFSLKNLSEEKTAGNESSWRAGWAGQLVVLFVAQEKSSVFSLKTRNWYLEFGSTKHSEEHPSFTLSYRVTVLNLACMLPELGGSTLAVSSQYWLSTSMSCSFIWSCAGYNAGMVENLCVKPLSHIPMCCLRKYSNAKIYQAFCVSGYLENNFINTHSCSFSDGI